MEITNNNLLNILLPNDNKVIKEALKQADMNQLATSVKSGSVQHILSNLFTDLTQGTKSNETIMNMLKNSNVFKELANFPKELQSLTNLIKNEPTLNAFQSKLENFMPNISQIDENNLKAQINNSGIFLESKIGSNLGNLSNNITNTLLELKQSLLNTPNIDSSNALKLIDSILSNANSSNPTKMFNELKELLNNLKTIVSTLESPNTQTNSIVQTVQKLETLFNKEFVNNQALNPALNQNIKPEVANELKTIFSQLQNYFNATNTQASQELNQLLDKLVQTQNVVQNPNFLAESKTVLSELKQLPQMQAAMAYNTQTNQIATLVGQLENIINKLSAEQTQTIQTQPNMPQLNSDVSANLKNILTELHKALANFNQTTNTAPLMQQIEQILLPQNFSTPQTLLNNLQQLLTQLHTTEPFGTALNNNAQAKELISLINRFEAIVTKEVINNPVFTAPHNNLQLIKEEVSHDMKAVLLQLHKEVSSGIQNQNTQEMLKQIDRLLVQIDYNQLMSLTSNANTVYIPFLWDLLEDGTIATAKGDNEKFYCQINLKLKEHGKLDLLLALDKNNIDITVHAQQEKFKQHLQANIQELRQNLSSVGLIPLSIKFYDLKEESSSVSPTQEAFQFVNQNSDELNLGINIRV